MARTGTVKTKSKVLTAGDEMGVGTPDTRPADVAIFL